MRSQIPLNPTFKRQGSQVQALHCPPIESTTYGTFGCRFRWWYEKRTKDRVEEARDGDVCRPPEFSKILPLDAPSSCSNKLPLKALRLRICDGAEFARRTLAGVRGATNKPDVTLRIEWLLRRRELTTRGGG